MSIFKFSNCFLVFFYFIHINCSPQAPKFDNLFFNIYILNKKSNIITITQLINYLSIYLKKALKKPMADNNRKINDIMLDDFKNIYTNLNLYAYSKYKQSFT